LHFIDMCDRWAPQPMLRGIEQLSELTRKDPNNARVHGAQFDVIRAQPRFEALV